VRRLRIPAALALGTAAGSCSPPSPPPSGDGGTDAGTDAGLDAGYDAGSTDAGDLCARHFNDAGMQCGCVYDLLEDGGGLYLRPYCDPDVGNPCPLGCFNPKSSDGGRKEWDAGIPLCLC
jgi:hypothetical protein